MQFFFYQPEYFLKFRCTGADCPNSCCDKWSIIWLKDEYERLINSEKTPEELRERVKENILGEENSDYKYKIRLCEDGRCPFHNRETGLCDIQKETDEDHLGQTCREYPRKYLMIDKKVFRHCMTSCPAVLKILLHDKKAMQLEEIPIREFSLDRIKIESPAKLAKVPYLQYRKEIIDFYTWLFTSRKNVEKSLHMGALAAKNISDLASDGMGMTIPASLSYMKDEWKGREPDIHEENIKKDYKIKHGYTNLLIKNLPGIDFEPEALFDGDTIDTEKYAEGYGKFRSALNNPDIALNNTAMNMFLNLFITMELVDHTFFEFYVYFSMCASAALFLGAAAGYAGGDIENNFIKAVSEMCRRLVHLTADSEMIFSHFESFRTPEQLATVI